MLHPLVVAQVILALDGFHHHLAGTSSAGIVGNGELSIHTGFAAQQRVDVVHFGDWHTIDCCDEVTLLDLHALLGER